MGLAGSAEFRLFSLLKGIRVPKCLFVSVAGSSHIENSTGDRVHAVAYFAAGAETGRCRTE
jgi:hypothetical protein